MAKRFVRKMMIVDDDGNSHTESEGKTKESTEKIHRQMKTVRETENPMCFHSIRLYG